MTLTKAAKLTKQLGVGLMFFAVIFLALKISFGGIKFLFQRSQPPPSPPKAAAAFGKLPFISLPSLPVKSEPSSTVFVLDTTTGKLPELPDKLWVYKFKKPKANLSKINKARTIAKSLGFNSDPIVISANEHLWQDKENGRKLKINIINLDLILETELKKIITKNLPNLTEAKQIAKNFLKSQNIPDEFFKTKPAASLLKIKNSQYRQALGLSEANVIKIDFFRSLEIKGKTKEDTIAYPILGPKLKQGLIQVFVANKKSDKSARNIPEARVFAYSIDLESPSDYPAKPIDKAYEELQQGKGYLVHLLPKNQDPNVSYTPKSIKKVTVRKVYLAYFDNQKFQPYLQPIYVFEGEAALENGEKAEYGAYIPAVSGEYAE